ncbi:hypothetical protein MTX26_14845 [Bradyrhizobium sp. ISRA443]|uniref:hypothetical protein n=1 Tax=unclassified Bradyrhizobium TaxID=2631580 RepID=UPI00247A674F|nr:MULTISPECIES: hypothetical protein [unclassified Bradyrhizobium]WGR91681.1 hypothetical protein MTX20_25375 [Bradyrhizobium sp. ISRA435]WGS02012.1 hypothetical protein MTX23_14855 [Bradyrhizobium sp. ISRA436]WGS08897.1 hypothetical protein MTX18_14845 [Bradyrhizobium sp. ISRA437]WGS15786.1 hypothetical protein MTX26_14845 [Bradyrhizobium sp. ISRA443]
MTDCIEAGGPLARPGKVQGISARYRAGHVATLRCLGLVALLSVATAHLAQARDPDGRYANSPLKQWFDGLRSGKGPCCSDADGTAVSDVDWETKDGHYRVRLDGQWIDVPDDAVITEPNRAGRAMVWPIRSYMGITIRCFMPGSMT